MQASSAKGDEEMTSRMSPKKNKLIWYIPAAVLIFALFRLPYGYYIFLRLIVCIAAGYLAYSEYRPEDKLNNWVIIFALTTILFNPLIKVFLPRLAWTLINIFCAGLFIAHFKINSKKSSNKHILKLQKKSND